MPKAAARRAAFDTECRTIEVKGCPKSLFGQPGAFICGVRLPVIC
jgi:hypothetical protein